MPLKHLKAQVAAGAVQSAAAAAELRTARATLDTAVAVLTSALDDTHDDRARTAHQTLTRATTTARDLAASLEAASTTISTRAAAL